MILPFYWVDAFADRVFRGNPAGLVPLAHWLPDAIMQAIARQNGLAETAFFVRTGPARWHLRWFTPATEIDLCGHATLATAFLLQRELGVAAATLTFDSLSGPLVVSTGQAGRLMLDFPARPPVAVEENDVPGGLLTALGGPAPRWIGRARDLFCVYRHAEEVCDLQPDFAALGRAASAGVIVTAPGGDDCDFVSRFFAPALGINEDPVTGSSHCTLVPYWAGQLDRTALHARQISARGGELWCEAQGERIRIAGHAVVYLRGTLSV